MHGDEHDPRGSGQNAHQVGELLQAHWSISAEIDHDDRPEATFGLQLLSERDAGVPLAAHGGLYIDALDVSLEGGLRVEHHRVSDCGDVAGDEPVARSGESHRSRDRRKKPIALAVRSRAPRRRSGSVRTAGDAEP